MTARTTFWIASCTKLMTTIAALQCVEQGLFFLDSADDVRRLIPERTAFDDIVTGISESGSLVVDKATTRITLRHLLTHTSGVSYDVSDPRLLQWRKLRGEESQSLCGDIVKGYNIPLLFSPGDGWKYGGGLDWAGLMVQRANDGIKLGEFMKKYIWDPLGMSSTTFNLERDADVHSRLARMSVRLPSGELTSLAALGQKMLANPAKDDLGGAGAYSSASEYLKVLASILRNDGVLVKSESVDEMFTPQLNDIQKAAYTNLVNSAPERNDELTGGIQLGTDVTWGLGGVIIQEDIADGRRKGSMYWSGLPNLHWVSRETRIHQACIQFNMVQQQ
jgi:CubicO group peptidase (beta-lactamase class C family)